MSKKGSLTLKIICILIVSDLLETLTQFCFKKSAMPESGIIIKNVHDGLIFILGCLSSLYLWAGFVSVLITFIIWSTVLSKIDLSVAVPIASSSYILVPLASIFFLHEEMTAVDWTGIFFIIVGVILISMSTKKAKVSL